MLATFTETAAQHGYPGVHADRQRHGLHRPVRLAAAAASTKLEVELRRLGIDQKNSRPNHPTTCGKVERFQQTMKKWLRAQPAQPDQPSPSSRRCSTGSRSSTTITRPHRSLAHQATPAAVYAARPKATPGATAAATPTTASATTESDKTGSVTLRHNGRLHHIGVGRTYAGTYVRLLVQDLDDPHRRHRHRRAPPRTRPRPNPRLPAHRKATRTNPQNQQRTYVSVGPCRGCPETSQGASGRIRTCGTWYRKPVLYPLSYGGMRRSRAGSRRAVDLTGRHPCKRNRSAPIPLAGDS